MSASITQALVLIGGSASRLKAGGIEVPISKSFLMLHERPLLYWHLHALHEAGIRRLVLAGSNAEQFLRALHTIRQTGKNFAEILTFSDWQLGAHGVPYEARYLLDQEFLFTCGHDLCSARHIRRLMALKSRESVVFSAFRPHPSNPRLPVSLVADLVGVGQGGYVLAHPIVADRRYAADLARHRFSIAKVLQYRAAAGSLKYAHSDTAPEFDTAEEMRAVFDAYAERSRPVLG